MKKVQILLSTYNGERFLEEQLVSLTAQQGVAFDILVRDDGSSDLTKQILDKWQKKGLLRWYAGKNIGPARSFLDLMQNAADADYYAFCDQDDVWDSIKLQKAVEKLAAADSERPALYFSRAQLVDACLQPIESKGAQIGRAYRLGQTLIKNNATGCTMVFNKKLLESINSYMPQYLVIHDWWLYLVCLALGGKVIYDKNSYIKYRQHGSNVVNGNRTTWKNYYSRQLHTLFNKEQQHKKIAYDLLNGYGSVMPPGNRAILCKVVNYNDSLTDRFSLLFSKDFRTGSIKYDLLFVAAVLFGAF
jgi:glycosyltransferase involved in cell wall biosynthesis